MISSFRSTVTATLIVVAVSVSACGGKKPEVKPTPQPAPTPERAPTEDEIYEMSTLAQLTASGVLKAIPFSYDSIVLTEEARGLLQKNAEYLKRRATAKVMVEGHADSRGTNEYNLALANRRADAVRSYLLSLGITPDRLTIVSKGEEQPFCKEETEACWQQNRVGFFVFTAK